MPVAPSKGKLWEEFERLATPRPAKVERGTVPTLRRGKLWEEFAAHEPVPAKDTARINPLGASATTSVAPVIDPSRAVNYDIPVPSARPPVIEVDPWEADPAVQRGIRKAVQLAAKGREDYAIKSLGQTIAAEEAKGKSLDRAAIARTYDVTKYATMIADHVASLQEGEGYGKSQSLLADVITNVRTEDRPLFLSVLGELSSEKIPKSKGTQKFVTRWNRGVDMLALNQASALATMTGQASEETARNEQFYRDMLSVLASANPAEGRNLATRGILGAAETAPSMLLAGASTMAGGAGGINTLQQMSFWTMQAQPAAQAKMLSEGVPYEVARTASVLSGLTNASVEMLNPFQGAVPSQGSMKKFVAQYLKQMGLEFTEEVVQGLTDRVFEYTARIQSDGNPIAWDKEASDYLNEMGETALTLPWLLAPGGIVGGIGTAKRGRDIKDMERVQALEDKVLAGQAVSRTDAKAWERVTGEKLPVTQEERTAYIKGLIDANRQRQSIPEPEAPPVDLDARIAAMDAMIAEVTSKEPDNASQVPTDQGSVVEAGQVPAGSEADRSGDLRVQGEDQAGAEAAGEVAPAQVPVENPTKGQKFYRAQTGGTDPGWMGVGEYHSNTEVGAKAYGQDVTESNVELENPLVLEKKRRVNQMLVQDAEGRGELPDPNIIPRVKEILGPERIAEIVAMGSGAQVTEDAAEAFTQAAQELGYDGVYAKNAGEVVVFPKKGTKNFILQEKVPPKPPEPPVTPPAPVKKQLSGTHISTNLNSLSSGFVERNPQLGVSIARDITEEQSSPTSGEKQGRFGRVTVDVKGNGLDYKNPEHKAYIDSLLEQDSRNIVPNLRAAGIDFVENWNSVGEDTELHVINPSAIQITGTEELTNREWRKQKRAAEDAKSAPQAPTQPVTPSEPAATTETPSVEKTPGKAPEKRKGRKESAPEVTSPQIAVKQTTSKNGKTGWVVDGMTQEQFNAIKQEYPGARRLPNGKYYFQKDPTESINERAREADEEARLSPEAAAEGLVRTPLGNMAPEQATAVEEERQARIQQRLTSVAERNDGVDQLVSQFVPQEKRGQFKLALLNANRYSDYDKVGWRMDEMIEYAKDHPELGLPTTPTELFDMLAGQSFREQALEQDISNQVDEEMAAEILAAEEAGDISFDFGANAIDTFATPEQRAIAGFEEEAANAERNEKAKESKGQFQSKKGKQKRFLEDEKAKVVNPITGKKGSKYMPGQETMFETEGLSQESDPGVSSKPTPAETPVDQAEIAASIEKELAKQQKLKRSQRKAQEADVKKQKFLDALDALAKSNKPTMGLDPEKVVLAVKAVVAAAEYSITKFDQLVSLAVEHIGEAAVRDLAPYLEEAARQHGMEDVTSVAQVLDKEEPSVQEPAGDTTSVKHAGTEELRSKAGLEERIPVAETTFEELDAEAKRLIDKDPTLAPRLAEEISRNPYELDPVKQAVLGRYLRELENRRKGGENVTGELRTAAVAAEKGGSAAGLLLGSRRMEYYSDFSLAALIRNHVRDVGEAPSDEVTKELAEQAATIERLEKELAEEQKAKVQAEIDKQIAEAKLAAEKAKKTPTPPSEKKGTKRERLQSRAKESVSNFKSKWNAAVKAGATINLTSGGLSPEAAAALSELTKAAAEVVKAYTAMNVNSFLEFMSKVRKDIGDLTPEQANVFKKEWEKERGTEVSPMGDAPSDAAIGVRAKQLLRAAVEAGITEHDAVIDAVHAQLALEGVEQSRSDTMDAITDYGQFTPLPSGHTNKEVRRLRGEIRQLRKIEDAQRAIATAKQLLEDGKSPEWVAQFLRDNGLLPKSTGRERATPETIERDLIAQFNKLKNKLPVSAEAKAGQLKTALQTAKTAAKNSMEALDNEIKSLTKAINERQRMAKPNERSPLKPDEELQKLRDDREAKREERKKLKKEYDKLFPPIKDKFDQQAEDAMWLARYKKSLDRQLEFWQQREKDAQAGIIPADKPKKRRADDLTSIDKRMEIDKQKRKAQEVIAREMRKRWKLGNWAAAVGEEVAAAFTSLMAGLEASFTLRQGVFYIGHPIRTARALGQAAIAAYSKQIAYDLEDKVFRRENALNGEYKKAAIQFTQENGPVSNLEELTRSEFMRWLAETNSKWLLLPRIPAKGYMAADRAWRTFNNTMRADLYDVQKSHTMALRQFFHDKLDFPKPEWTEHDIKISGRAANILSGRGTGLKGSAWTRYLFWAPRWVWSRVQAESILPLQMMAPKQWQKWEADSAIRIIHAELYVRAIVAAITHISALYFYMWLMSDDDDETPDEPQINAPGITTPLSLESFADSTLLKVDVAGTKHDALGGMQQPAVFIAKFIQAVQATTTDEKAGPYAKDAFDLGVQQLRYKFSVPMGAAMDFMTGETAVGEELPKELGPRAVSVIRSRSFPMAYRDMVEAVQNLGFKQGTASAALAFFGDSVSTYGNRVEFKQSTSEEREEQLEKDLKKMTWDAEPLAYSDLLSATQRKKVEDRVLSKRGQVFYDATHIPDSKTAETKQKAQETIQKNLGYLEQMKAEGVTHLQAQKLLIDYAYSEGRTDSYINAQLALSELYGGNFFQMPEQAEIMAYQREAIQKRIDREAKERASK